MRILLPILVLAAALAGGEVKAPPQVTTWETEPVEVESATRQTICLNGLWRFQPAPGQGTAVPADGWGLIRVPGVWSFRPHHGITLHGLVGRGTGPAWAGLEEVKLNPHLEAWNAVERGWYERPLAIPASWAGQAVILDLRRVCTDATVHIDGQAVGAVAWPGGELDLSAHVRAGTTHRLAVLVTATPEAGTATEFFGTGADQQVVRRKPIESRGLVDDVLLYARPAGARVSDVFVQTSTRTRRVDLDVELAGVAQAGTATFTARMLGPDGTAEQTFTATTPVVAAALQTVHLSWAWTSPRLWDLERPALYDLRLAVQGPGLADEYPQTFGFREFRVEGRRVLLNDTELRLRPGVLGNTLDQHFGKQVEIDAAIAGLRAAGFNCQEFWPWDIDERGTAHWRDLWYERAMRTGWPVMASLATMAGVAASWELPGVREAWQRRMTAQVRRWRNNPAIIMWVHSPNLFTDWYDQDPRVVGRAEAMRERGEQGPRRIQNAAARDANALLRALDPSRPIINHAGGAAGDFQTVNSYPCLAQVQETEEWLSDWVVNGSGPYLPVEFGPYPPLDYRRGRTGGGWGTGRGSVYTEQLPTEYLAAAFGSRAFREETPETRATNPGKFVSGQQYSEFNTTPDSALIRQHVADQLRRVYRAWRTIGSTTLPIPWAFQRGWDQVKGSEPLAPFRPGQRGLWWPTAPIWKLHVLRPEGGAASSWGQALIDSNGPTLAWIAAPSDPADPAAFTAKDHAFSAGQRVAKQAVLINDTRAEQPWSVEWQATLDGQRIAGGRAEGRIAAASNGGSPITFAIPALATSAAGVIELTARIGAAVHSDSFPFHAFPPAAPTALTIALWDPAGESAALLAALGCTAQEWDGRPGPGLVVVGRRALSSGATPPGDLEAHVRAGGRLLVLAQDPAWQRRQLGLRIGYQVVRQVFAVDARHPVMAGLDDQDLRDWAGSSTLVEPYPAVTARDLAPSGGPAHGWHWGNRGGVSSAMVEKPHVSGWRPILEGDFANAYTPLMELDLGAGRLIWCTLDLEDHVAADPAARRLAGNLLRYAASAPLPGRAGAVAYRGDATGARLLASLGVTVAERAAVLVAGTGAEPAVIAAQLAAGGTVLALDGAAAGVGMTTVPDLAGSWEVPDQPWCAGLSLSDLHRRCPAPASVVAPGAAGFELAAGGQLAWRRSGGGLLIVCTVDPLALPADRLTYLRITRWRQARLLSQILANLGAGFVNDDRIFHPATADSIALDGTWAASLLSPLPPSQRSGSHDDPGISAAARAALAPGFDDSGWAQVAVPARWSTLGTPWSDHDGEAVFRRSIEIPARLAGRDLELCLGTLDDYDAVFLDGVQVGAMGADSRDAWSTPRVYRIPAAQATGGRHVLAARIFDRFGDGGFTGAADDLLLRPAGAGAIGWYWPDHITAWATADDPHRYCRW